MSGNLAYNDTMDEKKFLDSARWLRKRAAVLRRDGYICQDCKRYGRKTPATLVHHVIPFAEDAARALDEKNLVSLCEACHNRRHPERAKGREAPPVAAEKMKPLP